MNLSEIKNELRKIKENITEQKAHLEEYIAIRTEQNKYLTEDVLKYLDALSKGKKNIPLPHNINIDELDSLTNAYIVLQKASAINYDSFEEMHKEIEEIKQKIESTGVPENMEGRQQDIIDCCEKILSTYDEITGSGFNTVEDICETMNNIINKILEIS